jgi:hypothetical protein
MRRLFEETLALCKQGVGGSNPLTSTNPLQLSLTSRILFRLAFSLRTNCARRKTRIEPLCTIIGECGRTQTRLRAAADLLHEQALHANSPHDAPQLRKADPFESIGVAPALELLHPHSTRQELHERGRRPIALDDEVPEVA